MQLMDSFGAFFILSEIFKNLAAKKWTKKAIVKEKGHYGHLSNRSFKKGRKSAFAFSFLVVSL